MTASTAPWGSEPLTAALVLADGTVIRGRGLGATGSAVGEVCFNTALTGYQEILTDPSYAGQIVTFTFPHIGNIGVNDDDIEDLNPAARAGAVGAVFKADVTNPSSYRAAGHLDRWLKLRGIIAISGIDTRALTAWIRENGMPNGVIAHAPDGRFDFEALTRQAKSWPGLVGLDLARQVTSGQSSTWSQEPWVWNRRLFDAGRTRVPRRRHRLWHQAQHTAPDRRAWRQGDGGSGHRQRRGYPGAEAGRDISVEWTR